MLLERKRGKKPLVFYEKYGRNEFEYEYEIRGTVG